MLCTLFITEIYKYGDPFYVYTLFISVRQAIFFQQKKILASDKNLENLSCCKNFGVLDLLKGLLERGLKKNSGRRGVSALEHLECDYQPNLHVALYIP